MESSNATTPVNDENRNIVQEGLGNVESDTRNVDSGGLKIDSELVAISQEEINAAVHDPAQAKALAERVVDEAIFGMNLDSQEIATVKDQAVKKMKNTDKTKSGWFAGFKRFVQLLSHRYISQAHLNKDLIYGSLHGKDISQQISLGADLNQQDENGDTL